jgi:hypothetical protein
MQHVIVLTLCLRVLPARLPCTPSHAHDSVRPRATDPRPVLTELGRGTKVAMRPRSLWHFGYLSELLRPVRGVAVVGGDELAWAWCCCASHPERVRPEAVEVDLDHDIGPARDNRRRGDRAFRPRAPQPGTSGCRNSVLSSSGCSQRRQDPWRFRLLHVS